MVIAADWKWLDEVVGPVDEDFMHAVNEKPTEQDRPELDFSGEISTR